MFTHFNTNNSIFRNNLLLIFFFIGSTLSGFAQDINWAIQPVITDADKIDLSESMQSKINLIKVKKGNLWGIKNTKNEIIVPVEYKSTSIWRGDKYCEGRNGRDQYFFDQEGYEVEFDEVDIVSKAMAQKKYLKEKNDNLSRLNEEFPAVSVTAENYNKSYKYIAINKETNDTISNDVKPKSFFVTSSLYSLQYDKMSKKYVVKNETGKIVKTFEETTVLDERKNDIIILRQEKLRGLFDKNFKQLLPFEYERIKFLGDDFVSLSKDGETYNIADRNGNIIPNISGTSIFALKGGPIVIKNGRYDTGVFNEETKTVENFDWGIRGKSLGENNVYRIINKDTLNGLYDFDLKKEVVPCQYRRAYIAGNLFVGGNYQAKKREMLSRKYEMKSIYNAKGELILKDSIRGIVQVNSDWIFVNDDKGIYRSFDGKGKLLEILPEGFGVSLKHGKYISIGPRGKQNYLHVKNYMLDKDAKGYESVSKPYNSKDKKTYIYIVSQNDKRGIVDGDGNILVPIELEEIELEYNSYKYMRAKMDGKWGAIHNPIYKEKE